jgi:hypothetical protein
MPQHAFLFIAKSCSACKSFTTTEMYTKKKLQTFSSLPHNDALVI